MSAERRRYFRINDTVKLSYQKLDRRGQPLEDECFLHMAEQDRRMEVLISELKEEQPKLIELIGLLNQKLERVTGLDRQQHTTLAYRARHVNMSACGLSFEENTPVAIGGNLALYLILATGQKLTLRGLVVGCQLKRDAEEAEDEQYIWRVDFVNVGEHDQELLIQNVVQRQCAQLANQIKITD